MKKNVDRRSRNMRGFQIPPIRILGKVEKVQASELSPGKMQEKSISIPKAVVAYVDMLGFSKKKDDQDIEDSLLDFSGPLAVTARLFPKVRFNAFSDCAFISIHEEDARDLIDALRFAFGHWIADGILVRGGVATGTYSETKSVATTTAPENFVGSLFSGSAVTAAVKLEGSGCGALLFTNNGMAEFLFDKYKEPILTFDNSQVIGWPDDDSSFFWFTGISLLRLLKLLSIKNGTTHSVLGILLNNLRYSFTAAANRLPPWSLVLALLSSPARAAEVRKKAIELLGIEDPGDFDPLQGVIDKWLAKRQEMELLEYLADSDSSIPVSKK